MIRTLADDLLARYPLTSYFVLVYAVAWGGILGVITVLAASRAAPSPADVGLVALPMLLAPGLAAVVLTALVEGRAGLHAMWTRLTHWRVGLHWYALATAVLPLLVLTILYALSALVSPIYTPTLALVGLAGLLAGYLEEIGWTGYATPRLLSSRSPVAAGVWLGVLWGIWLVRPAAHRLAHRDDGCVCADAERCHRPVDARRLYGQSGSVRPVGSDLPDARCAGVRHPRGRAVAGRGITQTLIARTILDGLGV